MKGIDAPRMPDSHHVVCFVWFTKVLYVQYEWVSISYISFN